jgi:hypothetical protein
MFLNTLKSNKNLFPYDFWYEVPFLEVLSLPPVASRTWEQTKHCGWLTPTPLWNSVILLKIPLFAKVFNFPQTLVWNLTMISQNCFYRCEWTLVLEHKQSPKALDSKWYKKMLFITGSPSEFMVFTRKTQPHWLCWTFYQYDKKNAGFSRQTFSTMCSKQFSSNNWKIITFQAFIFINFRFLLNSRNCQLPSLPIRNWKRHSAERSEFSTLLHYAKHFLRMWVFSLFLRWVIKKQ